MSERQPIGKELTSEHGLEEVAKGLAQGTVSRRRALGALGGILGGGLLAALIPGVARAQTVPEEPGNSPCVRCCREAYGVGTEEFSNCVVQGAQGLCPVDCDDCPNQSFCDGNGNGNNGECKYHEDKVCLNECPEGTVRTTSDDGSESTCETEPNGG